MTTSLVVAACAASLLIPPVLGGAPVEAQPPAPRQERVSFAKGTSSAVIKGQLKGDETVDYLVGARAGQTITVSLKPSSSSNYFNVLPPDSSDVAMYVGQTGDDFTRLLPADGDYKVRVYLVRAAARRNESSSFTLTIGVTGKALAPLPASRDALVPGTHFHAKGPISCVAMPYGDKTPKPCEAFVTRREGAAATVEVSLGNAGRRRILFVQGKPVVSDSSETMTAVRQGDITVVTFESGERHEIPDAFVLGG